MNTSRFSVMTRRVRPSVRRNASKTFVSIIIIYFLADAFAAATANHLKATLVAGKDADFEGLELNLMRV